MKKTNKKNKSNLLGWVVVHSLYIAAFIFFIISLSYMGDDKFIGIREFIESLSFEGISVICFYIGSKLDPRVY